MKLVKKLIYFSLFLALILLLQTFEQEETNLDLQTYKAEACDSSLEVTQSDRDNADSILSQLYDTNIRSDVTTAVNDQNVSMDLVMNLLKYIVPWAVFLIISLVGWLFYCCYCCCDEKCPPSKCCKRDYASNQLSKMEFYVPIGFAIVLNLLLFSASIAGLTYSGDVGRGMKAARCGLISLFYDVVYQNTDSNSTYPGLTGLQKNMDAISQSLVDFQNKLKTTFSGKTSASIKTQKQDVLDANNNMKRGQSNAAVPVNDAGVETYLSSNNFVDYVLASSSDSDFQTYAANYKALSSDYSKYLVCTPQPEALSAYYDGMVTTCEQLETFASDISSNSFDSSTLNSGSTTIQSFIDTMESTGSDLYTNTKLLSTGGDYATLALSILFGIGLGLSVVSIISIILMLLLKLYKLRGLLHFTWCIYVILMILCFLLALILHPSSVLFAEVCYYLNEFISDKTFYDNSKFITGQSKDIIASCFFPTQTKTLYEIMDLNSATGPLNDFTKQINDYKTQTSSFDTQKKQFEDSLNNNLAAFQNTKQGAVFDLKPADYSTYSAAFTKFNTFKSNSGCVELATQTCTDGKLPMKSSSDTDTTKYSANCWHPAYLATATPTCTDQSSLPETATLKAQYSKQSSLWNNALTKEQNVITLNNKAQKTFEDYLGNINSFITDADTIIKNLDDLLKGVDCSFLASSFRYLIDGLCVIFVPGVSKTTILIIIIAVSMFFGSLANCCVGLRAYRIQQFSFKGEGGSKIAPKEVNEETQGFQA